ncbi:hypothetical protein DL96DRAFT_1639411 [Flagelloscypha sp. PMI_526]|nr:hypothetical protein DL96DRAFT_1639411 [Flagelloscypha sp. PMI_526]
MSSPTSSAKVNPSKDHEIAREEALALLYFLGVALPPATKLPLDALLRRIRQCLDVAQETKLYVPNSLLNPSSLPLWTTHTGDNSVGACTQRFSLKDMTQDINDKSFGKRHYKDIYADPFLGLRKTLYGIAGAVDGGRRHFTIQDPDNKHCAISMRIVSIHKASAKTPLLVVIFLPATTSNPMPSVKWVEKLINNKPVPISSQMDMATEKPFQISFLLPLNTISSVDLGKLGAETGCEICGKNAASKCLQCQIVRYCGAECQKLDWPNHRTLCRSLKGGTWVTIPLTSWPSAFASLMPDGEFFSGSLDEMLRAEKRPNHKDTDHIHKVNSAKKPEVPSNIHGEKPFVIKLQSGVLPGARKGGRNMMIYDRQRSFQLYFDEPENDARVFDQVLYEMHTNGVSGGMKMYRYAKRTGDWEISLCVDRGPVGEVPW